MCPAPPGGSLQGQTCARPGGAPPPRPRAARPLQHRALGAARHVAAPATLPCASAPQVAPLQARASAQHSKRLHPLPRPAPRRPPAPAGRPAHLAARCPPHALSASGAARRARRRRPAWARAALTSTGGNPCKLDVACGARARIHSIPVLPRTSSCAASRAAPAAPSWPSTAWFSRTSAPRSSATAPSSPRRPALSACSACARRTRLRPGQLPGEPAVVQASVHAPDLAQLASAPTTMR